MTARMPRIVGSSASWTGVPLTNLAKDNGLG